MDYSYIYDINTIGRVFVYCAPANCDPVFKRTSGSNDTRFVEMKMCLTDFAQLV